MLDDPKLQVMQAGQEFAALATCWRVVSATSARRARYAAEVQVFNQMAMALSGRFAKRQDAGSAELRLLAQGNGGDGTFPSAAGNVWP